MKGFLSAFLELVVYVCISGSISHIVGYMIRRDKININSRLYSSFKWERDGEVYRLIKVAKWKNKLPDMSKYLRRILYPKKIQLHPDSKQLLRLIQETCVAECIHIMLISSSPLVYYYIQGDYGVLMSVLYALGNIPFIIIQRYNRPKFKVLYTQLQMRECSAVRSKEKKNESPDIVV